MEKHFEGEIAGRSATLFTAAFDQASGVGTYVAMESFEGKVRRPLGRLQLRPLRDDHRQDRSAELLRHRAVQRHRRPGGHLRHR